MKDSGGAWIAEPQSSSQGSSLRRLVPASSRASRINDLDNLIRTVRANHPEGDFIVISGVPTPSRRSSTKGRSVRAASRTSRTRSAVAQILAELGLGPRAIAAALLHDTVEDTGYALSELTAEFGDEIAMLVDGVNGSTRSSTASAGRDRPAR